MFITRFRMKKSYAAVDLSKNRIGNFVGSSCDDFDFGSGFAHDEGFIKEESINESEDDSVKNRIHGFEHRKENNNNEIHGIKSCRNRNMKKLVKDQRRNIHSAGGSAGTYYKTKSNSDSDSSKNGAEKHVIGKGVITENPVTDFKEQRIADGTENCGHGECFSEHKVSEAKHSKVENENKGGNRDMEKILNNKRNTGCSAKGNSGRKNKKLDAQRINDVSENYAKKRENLLFEFGFLNHNKRPFKNTLNKKTFAMEFSLTNVDRGLLLIQKYYKCNRDEMSSG